MCCIVSIVIDFSRDGSESLGLIQTMHLIQVRLKLSFRLGLTQIAAGFLKSQLMPIPIKLYSTYCSVCQDYKNRLQPQVWIKVCLSIYTSSKRGPKGSVTRYCNFLPQSSFLVLVPERQFLGRKEPKLNLIHLEAKKTVRLKKLINGSPVLTFDIKVQCHRS